MLDSFNTLQAQDQSYWGASVQVSLASFCNLTETDVQFSRVTPFIRLKWVEKQISIVTDSHNKYQQTWDKILHTL